MQCYLAQSKAQVDAVRERLVPCTGRETYFWGAGTHTSTLFQLGLLNDLRVAAIVDSNMNYQGRTVYRVRVIPPEELYTRPALSSRIAQESIYVQIRETMKLTNEVVLLY